MKTLLTVLVLTMCWAVTPVKAQTTDGVTLRPHEDLRLLQVKVKRYDPKTREIVWKFEGTNESGKEGRISLCDFTTVSIREGKNIIKQQDLSYFEHNFKEHQWIIIYTDPDNIALNLQQTSKPNPGNFFWWSDLRMKKVTVKSVENNVINSEDGAGSFSIGDGTLFTGNDYNSHVTLSNSTKENLIGEWVFTYERKTRKIVVAHKPSPHTAELRR